MPLPIEINERAAVLAVVEERKSFQVKNRIDQPHGQLVVIWYAHSASFGVKAACKSVSESFYSSSYAIAGLQDCDLVACAFQQPASNQARHSCANNTNLARSVF